MFVGFGLPCTKPRASAGARCAALFAVDAVGFTQLFFEMKGVVLAWSVLVADHVVRTCDYTTSATGA